MDKPRILFCASEVSPFAKTGGLADVLEALPTVLRQQGADVRIYMPFHRIVRERADHLTLLSHKATIAVGIHDYTIRFWETRTASGIPLYLLEKDEFFDRTHLYGTPSMGDYEDNAERFITFCRGVLPLCSAIQWYPTILHLHDWQTGLIAAYNRFHWRSLPLFSSTGTVFTIHNLAYQGIFPRSHFSLTGLPSEAFSMDGLEYWGRCNFLKAGLIYSDLLTTVSPRYAREIQEPPLGNGLDGVLSARRDSLRGILNGIDTGKWDPETDPFIASHFSHRDLSGKRLCKDALLHELGLPREHRDWPLLAMIGRLDNQKGFDLLLEILENLMQLPLLLAILGTGDAAIGQRLSETAKRYPDRIRARFEFNDALAHRIEAGADIFLMPSFYEPCGLNQMYSLRYGTLPVVHATGGLDDSVVDLAVDPVRGTGFKFYRYQATAFLHAVQLSLAAYRDRDAWRRVQVRAMLQDFSWKRSAEAYWEVYERVHALCHERKTQPRP